LPYLRLIDVEDATGELKGEYDAAVERAGKVFNIVKSMSLRPGVLKASMALYREIMFRPLGALPPGARAARRGRLGGQLVRLLNPRARRRPP
jgi:hypothetical protein